MLSPAKKAALVIGHPGHELRVFHWLELTQPRVSVLTDGSGHTGASRLPSTTRLIEQVGAERGAFYGSLSDRSAYEAILQRRFEVFVDLARALARDLIETRVDYVVGDAMEGYNPVHDVCYLVRAAAARMAELSSARIENFDFPLARQANISEDGIEGALRIELDAAALARKLAAAQSYDGLETEVRVALKENPLSAFKHESLRPVADGSDYTCEATPYYERYGAQQVAAGHYHQVIRYREHLLPLAEALAEAAGKGV